ncbi:MAG: ABC transporter permease [Alphaproteobacteria bacterium]
MTALASIADPAGKIAGSVRPGFAIGTRNPGLAVLGWGIALAVLLPIIALAAIASRGSGDLWPHLLRYVFPQAVTETVLLLAGTGLLVIAIGTGTAWLVTAFRFPGRNLFTWALLLPLAMPAYIVAYSYMDLLHPVGPVQTMLRDLLGISRPQDLQLPDIRSLGGCILLFGFVLYPYVYLNVRVGLLMQSAEPFEAAQIDGASYARIFAHIALPLVRPAIAAGAGLALMEALADLGASELLGVQTLTVSVYVTWVTRGSVEGAAQIALAMLVPVAGLLWLANRSRVAEGSASGASPPALRQLGLTSGLFAAAACAVPILLGFLAPAAHLMLLSAARIIDRGVSPMLLDYAWNSARFAAMATMIAIAAGFALALCQRYRRANGPTRLVQTGYAVPGTVLAVGLLGILSAVDAMIGLMEVESLRGALLLASAVGVVLAYLARFLAIPASALEAGYAKLSRALDEAAQSEGAGIAAIAGKIHWPLLRPVIGAAALLMFIECVKELPATLLLRPLNTETLATFLYGEASRGVYEDGAIAALVMLALGLLPLILLSSKQIR